MADPTLAEFLLARIADDETWTATRDSHHGYETSISKWTRRECDSKRQIVEKLQRAEEHVAEVGGAHLLLHGLRFAANALAEVYADHPDYRGEWRRR